jgi:aspartyl/asparaginyl beta-hydroxylase (cupin superfamily)
MKLDYHVIKAAVNWFFGRYVDRDRRPTFFNIKETNPGLDAVTQAYPAIRRELDNLLARSAALPEYHEIDAGERKISDTTPKKWSVFMLEILGHKPEVNRAWCPETCRVLERVPNMIQAFFSILEPGKSVPEHEGPYLGYLRYHLALKVPRDNPPKLVVNRQDYVWKEGEAVLFDDSWPHEVVNASNETRAVLIIDVRRPLPAMPDGLNRFMLDVVARHTYGRKLARQAERFAAGQGVQPQPI